MNPDLWLILLLAVVLDRIFGEPPKKAHPTVWMGIIIDFLKKKAFEDKRKDFFYGVFVCSVVAFSFTATA
ncbi:MAG: cobalamin biosynthesis protein, partial [Candidatus Hydrothermarchaeales archaeon]